MLVLLLLSLCSASFAQIPEHSWVIVVPAEGSNISLSCDPLPNNLIPLRLKIVLQENTNRSWVTVELNSIFADLKTSSPSLNLTGNVTVQHSCAAPNQSLQRDSESNDETFDPGKAESVSCSDSERWTTLTWSQQGRLLAVVTRGDTKTDVEVVRNGPSSIAITSVILPDNSNSAISKTVFLSCKAATGFWKFIEDQYWIIVVTALGYVLFCLTLTCGYLAIKRRRKAEKKRRAKARFFKVSTARNLYMDSINQEPENFKPDGMYQNFSLTKEVSNDRFSNKSSFLDPSEDGDSYLEPMSPEEAEAMSDDGDCYENANEEIKEGSIGSQSYEDMNGPINGQSVTPEKSRDEDADSYENMQTPVYSQLNRSVSSLGHSMEHDVEQTEPKMADVSSEQQRSTITELKQQNGDFYLSYQTSNF